MAEMPYRFVENTNTPEVIAHQLHDVEIIGGMARFTVVALREKPGSDTFVGEQSGTIWLPAMAVGPAIALTWQKMPSGVIVPAVGHLVRQVLSLH